MNTFFFLYIQLYLGPSFTHLQMPYRSFYIGASTPKQNPEYYLNCINELYRIYLMEIAHKSTSFIPLVINTHGWTRGKNFLSIFLKFNAMYYFYQL